MSEFGTNSPLHINLGWKWCSTFVKHCTTLKGNELVKYYPFRRRIFK